MALSKKQGIAIGVIAAAVVAVVGVGVTIGLTRPADAVAAPEPSASASNAPAEWVHTDAVPEAVAALKASGFTPIEPGKLTVAVGAFVPPLSYVPEGETLPSGPSPTSARSSPRVSASSTTPSWWRGRIGRSASSRESMTSSPPTSR